jgi:hypothetical protein
MKRTNGRCSQSVALVLFASMVLTGFVTAADGIVMAQSSQSASQPASAAQNGAGQSANDSLPEAPQPQNQPAQSPSGAAGAKAANAKGAPVAQPAGAAVAPARQHGHRSLIIKLGLLAGAGIAVGSVVALSERSPNRPPGTASARQ